MLKIFVKYLYIMQAQELKHELPEANAKLNKVTKSESSMPASMTSLRAELKTMQN